jgi:CBS domain-containing protein
MRTSVGDVMSSPVITVTAAATFREVVDRMHRGGFSGMPVVSPAGRLVGFVSEGDLLLKARSRAAAQTGAGDSLRRRDESVKAAATIASEVMSSPVLTVRPDTPVADAARMMHRHGLTSLPVVRGDGRLAGIVSRGDLLTVFLRGDDEIRRDVIDELVPLVAAGEAPPAVAVQGGVVVLEGEVASESRARALARAARQVDGVVAVRCRLVPRDLLEVIDEQPGD